MTAFLTILGGIILVFVNALFNGFVIMEAYELAFIPFINHFISAPTIPFMIFVLVGLGINLCMPQSESKYKLGERKFWTTWLSTVCSKLMLIFILWVFNIIVL